MKELKKMTMDIDAMGQQVTYDSDKETDRQSEIGKSIPETRRCWAVWR